MSQYVNVTDKLELDLYLTETPPEPKYFLTFNILSYWKNRQERYPNLCRLTFDVLSIPITIVASKSTFKYHAIFLPNNVQAPTLT